MEEWTPEPLVAEPTPFEQMELERRPVIVGYDWVNSGGIDSRLTVCTALRDLRSDCRMAGPSRTSHPTTSTVSLGMSISKRRLSRRYGLMASDPAALPTFMAHRMCI